MVIAKRYAKHRSNTQGRSAKTVRINTGNTWYIQKNWTGHQESGQTFDVSSKSDFQNQCTEEAIQQADASCSPDAEDEDGEELFAGQEWAKKEECQSIRSSEQFRRKVQEEAQAALNASNVEVDLTQPGEATKAAVTKAVLMAVDHEVGADNCVTKCKIAEMLKLSCSAATIKAECDKDMEILDDASAVKLWGASMLANVLQAMNWVARADLREEWDIFKQKAKSVLEDFCPGEIEKAKMAEATAKKAKEEAMKNKSSSCVPGLHLLALLSIFAVSAVNT